MFDKEIESNIETLKNKLKNEKSYEKMLEKYPVDWLVIKILENDTNVIARVKNEFGINLLDVGSLEKKKS